LSGVATGRRSCAQLSTDRLASRIFVRLAGPSIAAGLSGVVAGLSHGIGLSILAPGDSEPPAPAEARM
jgi:hypothetical protein